MEIGLSFILDCFDVRTPWTSGARAPHKVSSLANNWANIFLRVQNFDNFKTNPYLKMLRSMTKSINMKMLPMNSKGLMVKLRTLLLYETHLKFSQAKDGKPITTKTSLLYFSAEVANYKATGCQPGPIRDVFMELLSPSSLQSVKQIC